MARAPKKPAADAAAKEGRAQLLAERRAVRNYLVAVTAPVPTVSRESLADRHEKAAAAVATAADPVRKLEAIQRRLDIEAKLALHEDVPAVADAEPAFLEVAAAFGRRKGISYAAWREVGVPAATLKRAGITRAKG